MFIAHFAAGMAGKKVNTSVSLGTLFFAGQFLDLLWPTLLLLGIEQVEIQPGISVMTPLNFVHYPVSHSLMAVIGWGLLFAGVHYLFRRNASAAIVLGCLVVSHWFLDLVVHIPDLPLYPGVGPLAGLGLWNYPALAIAIEGGIFLLGILWYYTSKRAQNKNVSWWFWSLCIFLAVVHIMNLVGPPPPSVQAIAWVGQLQWLFVIWGWWADKKSA